MSQTLQDTSAAEKMDGVYRRQRFIYDATRRYYLLGRDRLITQLDIPLNGKLLEIGCGTARNLIQAARRYPSAQLYGLDVSEAMLKTARKSIERAGLDNRTRLAAGDARSFDAAGLFENASFRPHHDFLRALDDSLVAGRGQKCTELSRAWRFFDDRRFRRLSKLSGTHTPRAIRLAAPLLCHADCRI